ncbi:transmembrane protein 179B [Pantherophis guttatus]|uniref:Transmembrane protein 179B n=1 Tax=Pantherophis guttatus TaxID=94885 RepID=A0A6P9CSG4_PANGU|nr:transmembrane protein 179B [Pantherophis guttatus]
MARPSGWLLLEVALNAAALLAALGCAAALGLAQGGFGGKCILYGSVDYNGTLILLSSSPPSLCYFISAISGLTAIFNLVSLLRGLYSLCFGDGHLVHTWIRTSLVVSATLLFFLLVSACILRVGMDFFCGSIQKSKAAASCQEAQQRPWVKPYHPGKFYNNLYAAQATAWVNFLFWFLMSFLLFVECIRKAPYQSLEVENPQTDKTVPAFGDQSQ